MSFQSSTFIAPYNSTDRAIRFQDNSGMIVGGFNVCLYDSITFEGKQVWISFNVLEKLVLEFVSDSEAELAANELRSVIDTLFSNCPVTGSGSGSSGVYTETFTPGTVNVPNTITHGLNTTDIMVTLWDEDTNEIIYTQIENRTATEVDILFSSNPTGDVRVIVSAGGGGSGSGVTGSVISKTLNAFNADRLANTLVPGTAYRITDTNNDFNLPAIGIFTGIVDATNTGKLRAVNTTDDTFVEIDFDLDKIIYLHDSLNNNEITGNVANFSATGSVENVTSINSTLTLEEIDELYALDTIATVSNSTMVNLENCQITLDNCSSISFYGITGDYSSYAFVDIKVDSRIECNSKPGAEVISNVDGEVIEAFIDTEIQVADVYGASLTKRLANAIPTVSTRFIIEVPATIGTGIVLTIKDDASNTTLLEIDDKFALTTIEFNFNVSTGEFELGNYTINSYKQSITVGSTGQTIFTNILPFKVSTSDNPTLVINGVEYNYGTNFTVVNRTLTWNAAYSEFALDTDDDVQFEIGGSGR